MSKIYSGWERIYQEERRNRDLEMSTAANLEGRLRRMVGIALRYRRERDKARARADNDKPVLMCGYSGCRQPATWMRESFFYGLPYQPCCGHHIEVYRGHGLKCTPIAEALNG